MPSNKSLTLWLLGALTWLFLLSSPIHAAPTGTPSTEDISDVHPMADLTPVLSRAAMPDIPKSKADLKKEWFKGPPKKDKSCFFTRMDVTNGQEPRVVSSYRVDFARHVINFSIL
jgi:hypothetical protein